ncbi:bifunctional folylpolyglutamate synthase/dihydrofolate synthase [Lichenicoccus sp.]|uniref:bifunctional folylpolyglutamate synthase/dihydrofolate synthase n=1 Tax=Lichenicoccus sp. TaxID=2781899 RepID=UPI003D09B2F5
MSQAPGLAAALGASPEFVGRSGAVLERLHRLYPALIDLSLGRLQGLLDALGHPERRLPPVVHVAGTNGKGSTCATLRAIAEAAGWRTHVTISPHLVDITERYRIAGQLVSDVELTSVLEEIERVNQGDAITVFEVLTAAGFLLFSRHPADLAIIEVGLGGRYDATNVLPSAAASVITAISMDHEAFLGETIEAIAAEKAGIIKPGVPVVTGRQPEPVLDVLEREARRQRARLLRRDQDWRITSIGDGLRYEDDAGALSLPTSALRGPHQIENTGLAVAALRAAGLKVPEQAWSGIACTSWPARMQRLSGALADGLPDGWELWLDGGHNPGAGVAIGAVLATWHDRPVDLVIGMKQSKDAAGFLRPLLGHARTIHAVVEPHQHMALPVEAIIEASGGRALPGPTVAEALACIVREASEPGRILICGSLYLAGEVLKADGWRPS